MLPTTKEPATAPNDATAAIPSNVLDVRLLLPAINGFVSLAVKMLFVHTCILHFVNLICTYLGKS